MHPAHTSGERTAASLLGILLGLTVYMGPRSARADDAVLRGQLRVREERKVPLQTDSGLLAGRSVFHRSFEINGIPVRGAFESVVHSAGSERIAMARRPTSAPQVEPGQAVITRAQLPGLVADFIGAQDAPRFESAAELVYLVILGAPVLVWEVQLPLTLRPTPSRRTFWISAVSGRVLDDAEQVLAARARVFTQNPSKTPFAVEVDLPGLVDLPLGAPLEGTSVHAFNCLDEATWEAVCGDDEEVPSWVGEHECFPRHLVFADAAGDFSVPVPNVVVEQDNLSPMDGYAELSMYYHGATFLALLQDKGLESFVCETSSMLANMRGLEPSVDRDYTPLSNAFYTNQCDAQLGMTMVFGQGSGVDFAYDGDVVYHELGHGVVATLTPEGLGRRRLRADATVIDAGGINEGLADYFAFMTTNDPRLAEYVGRFWQSVAAGEIRNGENTKRCPDNTVGQVHTDGEPIAAALWATRVRIGPIVDEIVLSTLPLLPADATYEEFSAATLEVADQLRVQGRLDDFGYEALERALATRGLIDCPRVLADQERVTAGVSLFLRAGGRGIQPFFPGPMQLRYDVASGVDAAEVTFSLSGQGIDDPGAQVLVKRGGQPITFTYTLVAVDDPPAVGGSLGRVREVVLVEGDWDETYTPIELEDGSFLVELDELLPGDAVHMSVASLSTQSLVATGLKVVAVGAATASEATGARETSGVETSERVFGENAVAGGCGCRQPAGQRWGGLWLLLGLAGLLAERRRS